MVRGGAKGCALWRLVDGDFKLIRPVLTCFGAPVFGCTHCALLICRPRIQKNGDSSVLPLYPGLCCFSLALSGLSCCNKKNNNSQCGPCLVASFHAREVTRNCKMSGTFSFGHVSTIRTKVGVPFFTNLYNELGVWVDYFND